MRSQMVDKDQAREVLEWLRDVLEWVMYRDEQWLYDEVLALIAYAANLLTDEALQDPARAVKAIAAEITALLQK